MKHRGLSWTFHMVGVVGCHSSSLRFRNTFARQYPGTSCNVISCNCNRQHNTNRTVGFPSNRPSTIHSQKIQRNSIMGTKFQQGKHNRVTLKYFQEVDHKLHSTDRWCTIGKIRMTFKLKRVAQFRLLLTKPIFGCNGQRFGSSPNISTIPLIWEPSASTT
jgi:hypothetical protein